MRAYIDSDILIWHLRGEPEAAGLLRRLSRERGTELWTGALQRAEVIFFMRPQEETATLSFLSRFKTEPVTQEAVDAAGAFYREWHPSHGIDVNDAILAATASITGGKIYTRNLKHYPMPDIAVLKGW
ncbi:MAG: type II toxin-antitoxin system VapC family toxin [Thermoanaerobaculia bacterium]